MTSYKNHTTCRVCNSDNLQMYLDLGMLPLSNNLTDTQVESERFPLQVMWCSQCGLSQLSIVIPPEVMFSHYVYRSSISEGYKEHCHQMAADMQLKYNLNINSFHIDIAGNDGALINEFRGLIGCKSLNVDPADNLVKINEQQGIRIFRKFWSIDAAKQLETMGWQKADIITATNVFAHVDDVKDFIEAAAYAIKPNGVLVIEVPYLISMIEGKQFDTIYFEHLSYMSVYPITLLCQAAGLNVMNVTKQDIHGGSIRLIIGRGMQDGTVAEFVKRERMVTIEKYREFAEDVQLTISQFRSWVLGHHNIAAFAASAKGNTLLNCAGITSGNIPFIVDQTEEKIGKFSPGTKIPIVPMKVLVEQQPEYLIVLAWNFFREIQLKTRFAGFLGKFVIPIPEIKIITV